MEEKINNLHKDYLIIKENKLRNEIELANCILYLIYHRPINIS